MKKVAIIGGGAAGVSAALMLEENVTLFEKKDVLVSGPPFCHLHAGGNLYPDISLNECKQLLIESIEFAKFYPFAIDYRPTIFTFPKSCEKNPQFLLERLKVLQKLYEDLVAKDNSNKVLGDPKNYFKLFNKEDLLARKKIPLPKKPQRVQDWLIPFAKEVNLDALQYPIFLVNEFGINLFAFSAGVEWALKQKENVKLLTKSKVIDIQKIEDKFLLRYTSGDALLEEKFDYLINAAGFESGFIDKKLGFKRQRMVEFKAAYLCKWDNKNYYPEIIFHGKRGTKRGMAQFTPYNGGYFQLHGMSKDITLFEDGLFSTQDSFVQLPLKYLEKIEKGCSKEEALFRAQKAIEFFANFIPKFSKEAIPTKLPLFGAQQIPGSNPSLRAAEVSFEANYARCEIVKVSSALAMVKAIAKEFNLNVSKAKRLIVPKEFVQKRAQEIAQKRGYPKELGKILYSKNFLL